MPARLFAMIAMMLGGVALAADPPKPKPLLTEKELAAGWVLLFDGESTYGWDASGDVAVKDGVLTLAAKAAVKLKASLPPGLIEVSDGEKDEAVAHTGGAFEVASTPDKPRSIGLVKFIPSALKPIFNGKDLSGWTVFQDDKRMQSKAEVTKDGELRLTNGPGDLQADGKHADFVVQLECKTNGEGLNSGVFFRCVEGQYQNGYEFQIHNGIVDGDRTKPKDGGTGAIYRRQAARKVVSNDNEWTHLTLVARGPTFATWVNGVPVAVWTDERAKDENPRKGLRLDAGHLSLQGHDKTTDLLFRNIRLADFPAVKK